jgi:hypothetical protein
VNGRLGEEAEPDSPLPERRERRPYRVATPHTVEVIRRSASSPQPVGLIRAARRPDYPILHAFCRSQGSATTQQVRSTARRTLAALVHVLPSGTFARSVGRRLELKASVTLDEPNDT